MQGVVRKRKERGLSNQQFTDIFVHFLDERSSRNRRDCPTPGDMSERERLVVVIVQHERTASLEVLDVRKQTSWMCVADHYPTPSLSLIECLSQRDFVT